jgi:hypothetical protein
MKNYLMLLVVVAGLYLAISVTLQGVYGPSYGFLSGEDRWAPDGQGGWKAHGQPESPFPAEASVNVPLAVRYLPIFVPGLVLAAFLFTPLRKKLDPPEKPDNQASIPPEDKAEEPDPTK